MPPEFIPGIELSRRFYAEVVAPLVSDRPHAAGLIGCGSEVLGYDDPTSTDHDWGARVQIFLTEWDSSLEGRIGQRVPSEFLGFQVLGRENRPAVAVWTIEDFWLKHLRWSPAKELTTIDWLSFSAQKLREVTSGEIFHDDVGLQEERERLRFYPRDVWLYILACHWHRVGEDEHLMGRAGMVGDDLGSRIIAARIAGDLMRIALLADRQYPPYPKWLGSAFSRLSFAAELNPHLHRMLQAENWHDRQESYCSAASLLIEHLNAKGLVDAPAVKKPFFTRPYNVVEHHSQLGSKLAARINDSELNALASSTMIGNLDCISDSTEVLSTSAFREGVIRLLESARQKR